MKEGIEVNKTSASKQCDVCHIEDINKIVASNKVSFGKKGFNYFIGYKDAQKIKT